MPRIRRYIPYQNLRIELVREAPAKKYKKCKILHAGDVYDVMHKEVDRLDREHFWVIPLTAKNQVIGINLVSIGSLNSSVIHPREVFKPAILTNAASVILVHNHPSGDFTPSQEDKNITERLRDAGNLLGIKVFDHIIIGDKGYYGMAGIDFPAG